MAQMTGQHSSKKPDDESPLGLADSSHGSSTQMVPGGTKAGRSADASRDDSMSASAAGGSQTGGDLRGKSTSLETMLGRVFIDRGYITAEELQACRGVQEQAGGAGEPKALADILIENEFVTRKQLDRVRTELEAEKSTQQIPGYKIMKKLGSGAMATVFLARQLSLDRLVAIKVLPAKFSTNQKFIERFYKEGRAAAQLNHRNIVAAYDVGQSGDHHYFVMEYVDGETVYERLVRKKRLPEEEAIRIARQVAEALVHAHEKGFIHRDIKPKNIMLTSDGTVKLADLGLARAVSDKEAAEAEAGRAYGTPYYISPEQIRGAVDIGPPADIYGLGATFYHMVTGKVPFEGKNPSAVMHKHLKQTLVPPDHVNTKLGPGTAQVIEMMMAKSRKDRYQNVKDLIVDLDRIGAGEPPHFAHATHDLTAVAVKVEESVKAAPVAVAPPPKRGKGLQLDDPLTMAVVATAALSVLINVILVIVLASGGGGGGSGAPAGGNANGGSGTPPANSAQTASIIGTWQSSSLTGSPFVNATKITLIFEPNGRGKLISTDIMNRPSEWAITYTRTVETLSIHVNTRPSTYAYQLEGNTLTMTRWDDQGELVSMVLQRR